MDIRLLDKSFQVTRIIDVYSSVIWTDRYYECGDFELMMPLGLYKSPPKVGTYLTCPKSDRVMMVESVQIDRSCDNGTEIKLSGRSLEAILDRRVIYEYLYFIGGLEDYIKRLLNNAIISPSAAYRRILNFKFENSEIEGISALTLEAQHQGQSLYTVVCELCKSFGVGWRIRLEDGKFVFSLYIGEDKSDRLIFSESMDTMSSVQFLESDVNYRNAALVLGEEKDNKQRVYTDVSTSASLAAGLSRREIVVESSARSSSVDDSGKTVTLSDAEYQKVLKNAGLSELAEYQVTKTANGEINSSSTSGKLGDLVTINPGFGESSIARISEITHSYDSRGYTRLPSFEVLDLD